MSLTMMSSKLKLTKVQLQLWILTQDLPTLKVAGIHSYHNLLPQHSLPVWYFAVLTNWHLNIEWHLVKPLASLLMCVGGPDIVWMRFVGCLPTFEWQLLCVFYQYYQHNTAGTHASSLKYFMRLWKMLSTRLVLRLNSVLQFRSVKLKRLKKLCVKKHLNRNFAARNDWLHTINLSLEAI